MTHIIYLWLMISPGVWDKQTLIFDTYDECRRATYILMDYHSKPRYIDIPKRYLSPAPSAGVMFFEKCGE